MSYHFHHKVSKGAALTLKANSLCFLFALHFFMLYCHSVSNCQVFADKGRTIHINLNNNFKLPTSEDDRVTLKMCTPPKEDKAKANQAPPQSMYDHVSADVNEPCSFLD